MGSRVSPASKAMATGALLLHGYTGSPQSMQDLALAFERNGFVTEVPVLPGHGSSIEDLMDCCFDEWVAAVDGIYRNLAARCSRVVVAGLSVGGMLATWLAAVHHEVAALVCINPFIDPPAESFREILRGFMSAGSPVLPKVSGDMADGTARELAYDVTPIGPLLTFFAAQDDLRLRLGDVACPVLIITSRQDHVVPTVSSDILAAEVGGPVERLWLEHSFHTATLDLEHTELERRAVEFALRYAVDGGLRCFDG